MLIKDNNINEYEKNGLTIFRKLLPKDEVNAWRELIKKEEKIFHKGRVFDNNEFYSHLIYKKDFIKKVLLKSKIIEAIKKILGNEIYYFGDSSLNLSSNEEYKKTGIFHIDAKGDSSDPYTSSYKMIRVGIYLQNTKDFSGTLKYRIGSHKQLCFKNSKIFIKQIIQFIKGRRSLKSFARGKIANLNTEVGDVAIWNLRLHHCGNSRRNRFFPKKTLHPWFDRNLPDYLFLPVEKRRLVFFSVFAAKSAELESYIQNRLSNNYNLSFYKNSGLSFSEAEQIFSTHGVNLINTENYNK